MDLNELYKSILKDLEEDKRPYFKLSKEDIGEILKLWNDLLTSWNEEEFRKILCIVDHGQTLSRDFANPIIQTLELNLSNDLMIYTLASAQKHIITKCALDGVPVPSEFVVALKKLLDTKEPEVFEWVLRTIESMGNQSLKFKDIVPKKKPSFFALFNPHMKAAKGIIQLLEKRWAIFK